MKDFIKKFDEVRNLIVLQVADDENKRMKIEPKTH
jgi:hypothetical protein